MLPRPQNICKLGKKTNKHKKRPDPAHRALMEQERPEEKAQSGEQATGHQGSGTAAGSSPARARREKCSCGRDQ